jgi:hypothetical protein
MTVADAGGAVFMRYTAKSVSCAVLVVAGLVILVVPVLKLTCCLLPGPPVAVHCGELSEPTANDSWRGLWSLHEVTAPEAFFTSEAMLLASSHSRSGVSVQAPLMQRCVEVQLVPHAPQLVALVRGFTQLPLHATLGAVQAAGGDPQVRLAPQTWPDAQQNCRPHSEYVAGQLKQPPVAGLMPWVPVGQQNDPPAALGKETGWAAGQFAAQTLFVTAPGQHMTAPAEMNGVPVGQL